MIYLTASILVIIWLYSEVLRLRRVTRLFKQDQVELQEFLDSFAN
jgi:hypothetical protein